MVDVSFVSLQIARPLICYERFHPTETKCDSGAQQVKIIALGKKAISKIPRSLKVD